jgi:hypothetical protein
MKILFLDIDGVLNSAFVLEEQRRGDAISREMIERVNKIVDATGCKIVISSTWRIYQRFDKLTALLYSYGLRRVIIDATEDLGGYDYTRGDEINEWVFRHREIEMFVILDDNKDDSMVESVLVQTTFKHGLQDEHVAKAIAILS